MLEKHSLLRISAASVATMFFAMGVAAPVHAADNGQRHKAPRATHQSAMNEHTSKSGSHGSGASRDGADNVKGTSTDHRRSKQRHAAAHPPKHDPVTVCHLLGNGSYNILTFDDSALKAHTGHGDIYPVPAGGCPVAVTGEAPAIDNGTGVAGENEVAPGKVLATPAEIVLQQVLFGTVLGVQAQGTANRAPAQVAPAHAALGQVAPSQIAPATVATARVTAAPAAAAGILPRTGAGEVALPLAGGLGLLVAGAVMLTRRRSPAGR